MRHYSPKLASGLLAIQRPKRRCSVPAAELSRAEGERRLAEAEAAYATIEASTVAAEQLALERIQSARALVEPAGVLLAGQ